MYCVNSPSLYDRCKHKDKDWWEEPCESCTGENGGYEPDEGTEPDHV